MQDASCSLKFKIVRVRVQPFPNFGVHDFLRSSQVLLCGSLLPRAVVTEEDLEDGVVRKVRILFQEFEQVVRCFTGLFRPESFLQIPFFCSDVLAQGLRT